jgi:ubiquinone/menaquinone biosynthesis C-methylase UbiE
MWADIIAKSYYLRETNPDSCKMIELSEAARHAWAHFLDQADNRGHASRNLSGPTIDSHVAACLASARQTAARVAENWGKGSCHRILEIGCSTGVNCLALAEQFPRATIVGIEPESAAVSVAQTMATGNPAITFLQGVGEQIPLDEKSVDIIVCHTVIEHVSDVDQCLREMVRVLAPGGMLSLEAPNYRFPREPHLGIWCLPTLGKPFVRLCAKLQGKGDQSWFINHLQFVTTGRVIHALRQQGCDVSDNSRSKLLLLATGSLDAQPGNARAGKWLRLSSKLGLTRIVVGAINHLQLYPSMLLTARIDSSPAPAVRR